MNARRSLAAGGALAAAGAAAWLASRARRQADAERPEGFWLPPGRSSAVESADGTRIHVEEFGDPDGPPLVLVHAWMCSLELWHRQITALAPEARIIAYDLRGHGRSGASADGDYSIESFADDLDAVLAARLADGDRAVICGHSMGAMTVAAWAHRHPDQVARRASAVALLATGMGDLITQTLVLRTPEALGPVTERIGRAVLSTELPIRDAPEPFFSSAVRHIAFGSDPRPEDIALVAQMVRDCAPRVRGGAGSSLSRLDVFDGLAQLDLPTVVIAGGRDRMTPPAHSHRIAELLPRPRPTEMIEEPGAGHMVPLEADETVTSALRGLLAGDVPRPASALSATG